MVVVLVVVVPGGTLPTITLALAMAMAEVPWGPLGYPGYAGYDGYAAFPTEYAGVCWIC